MVYTVPHDTGYIIGNLLRQMLLRTSASWQIIAYDIGKRDGILGFAGDIHINLLDLHKGTLLSSDIPKSREVRRLEFRRDGDDYVADGFTIKGLSINLDKIIVYIRADTSTHSSLDNYDILSKNTNDMEGIVCVPSNHSKVSVFTFTVETGADFDMIDIKTDVPQEQLENVVSNIINILGTFIQS